MLAGHHSFATGGPSRGIMRYQSTCRVMVPLAPLLVKRCMAFPQPVWLIGSLVSSSDLVKRVQQGSDWRLVGALSHLGESLI